MYDSIPPIGDPEAHSCGIFKVFAIIAGEKAAESARRIPGHVAELIIDSDPKNE